MGTKANKTEVERRVAAGESMRAIAASIGMSHQSLSWHRKRWGCKPMRLSRLPTGARNPNWKGGIHIDKWGYVNVRQAREGRSNAYIAQHVLVAEETVGRNLIPGEVVHHINGDKMDNSPANLIVTSRTRHRVLHRQLESIAMSFLRDGLIVFDGENYKRADGR